MFVQRVLYAILSPEIDLQRVPLVTARLVYSCWQGSGDDDNHSAKEGANKSYGTRAFTGNPLILND
ncbi:hypothetical protein KAM329D_44620 [Aeromonas caviae]|uniref:Uncharacterized protein n=1 Tax=Aeromonas caviae TaxID=648 RepID=A0AAV4YTC7_AERCA|nr:hypothetical protein KAM329_034340 [Aeromonas caviae]GJA34524.1 hypothetical protein KAM341_42020 [Aeromonas caviae]GJA38957.1 hypothetical protein KAM342_42000 [Aeromonas caviae]GJA43501.1 hypothetical protein KAM343_42970 [Aeromonas caviae]GJA61252.1 hypothetical protein KAM350_42450 [Aeromonas caviae]